MATADVNSVTLIGRVMDAPEQANERAPVKFTLSTSDSYLKEGEWQNVRDGYFKIVCWKQTGEDAKALREGDTAFVHGRLKQHSYDKDGTKVYVTDIHATTVGTGVPDGAISPEGPAEPDPFDF